MKYIKIIVRKMLDLQDWDDIPEELWNKIQSVDILCHKAGGALASRQTLAVIVHDYLEKHNGWDQK